MRRPAWLAAGLALTALYGANPWEWGMMDDVALNAMAQASVAAHGWLEGILANINSAARTDQGWGLLRPSYWVYSSTVYLLPPRLVYVLRFLMLAATIALSLHALAARVGKQRWIVAIGAAALLANRPLFDGLSFVSLQESSGLFFAALGAWLALRPKSHWAACACYLVAAGFKPPFVWLVLFSSLLRIRTSRREAALSGALGLGFLFAATVWARSGTYTGSIAAFEAGKALSTALAFAKFAFLPATILAALAIAARPGIANFRARLQGQPAVFLASGAFYLLTLLPWGATTGYYFAPPVFLLTFGFLNFLAPSNDRPQDWPAPGFEWRIATLAFVLSAPVAAHGVYKAFARNHAIVAVRDWALTLAPIGLRLAANGEESSARLEQLVAQRSGGRWKNTVKFIQPAEASTAAHRLDYYVSFADQGVEKPLGAAEITLQTSLVTVYRLH